MSGSTDDTMMTSGEASHFVQHVLGISSPSTRIKTNPLNFVDDILRAWLHHIPFQSVKGMATPHHLRHLPTGAEIKHDMTTSIGGLCYHHNIFCSSVLRALGFQVSLVSCDVSSTSSHVAIIVHNMTREGSKHYVDLGMGDIPFFHAIPFDFQDESPVYQDSFLRYKFSRRGDVIHCLTEVEGHPFKHFMQASGFKVIDGWFQYIAIHPEERVEISHFTSIFTQIYTIVGFLPFLSMVISMAFPNGRFVCIKDNTLLLENEAGCISRTYLRSRDEIKDAYVRYFPQFSEAMIDDALNDENAKLDFEKGISK